MQQYIWAHFFPLDDLKKISTLYYLKFFLSEILSKGFFFFFFAENSNFTHTLTFM